VTVSPVLTRSPFFFQFAPGTFRSSFVNWALPKHLSLPFSSAFFFLAALSNAHLLPHLIPPSSFCAPPPPPPLALHAQQTVVSLRELLYRVSSVKRVYSVHPDSTLVVLCLLFPPPNSWKCVGTAVTSRTVFEPDKSRKIPISLIRWLPSQLTTPISPPQLDKEFTPYRLAAVFRCFTFSKPFDCIF